ncbi:MAG: threonylcarbamoyl-AMP synthase [Methanobrevibacter woesei]|uniref:L-threonylcarbamoyladenylate synthase n=1 Tax=Methanobrevibacter woesei TaxID=190976 RepID=UPI0023F030EA|nr:L-threonylcarbamoyladenylate synthase [Methanobrevibacter woesei]MCI7290910.1 threonylcarbamoyl-AMP synthase [Methanobrevibacter woesei]
MRILKTNNENPDKEVIEEAIKVMAHGGVVLYPTDTVYGLGVNIFNKKAVRRIYDIKKRSLMKPLSIIVSSKDAISHVANLRTRDKIYVDKFLPGPYTLILNKTKIVPRVVTSGLKHVGVRIPDNEIACRISDLFPVTTTSANLSDHEVCETPDEILDQLNHDVDLVIDVGKLKRNKPSTIINLTSEKPIILER